MASVTVIDASGNQVVVSTTRQFINLVYGQGYRPLTGTIASNLDTLLEGAASSADQNKMSVLLGDLRRNDSLAVDALEQWFVRAGEGGGGVAAHDHDTQYFTEAETTALLAGKSDTGHGHVSTDISDSSVVGRDVLTASTQAAARSAIGAGTSNLTLGTTSSTAKAGDYAPPAGTTSAAGILELATTAETTTGTDTVRAVTPAGVKAVGDTKAPLSHTHGVADLTATGTKDTTTFLRGDNTWAVPPSGSGSAPDASTTVKGIVQLTNHLGGTATAPTVRAGSETQTGILELATAAETTTGTSTALAVHPAGLKVELDKKANTSHTHGVADLTATGTKDTTTFLRGDNTWAVPPTGGTPADASTTVKGIVQLTNHLGGTATAPTVRSASETQTGIVELATTTEATTGTDTARAVTPAGLKAATDALGSVANANDTLVKRSSTGGITVSSVSATTAVVTSAPTLGNEVARLTELNGKANTSHTHGVTDLTATGTKDATTFLRGDNTWAVPAGGGGGWTAVDASETVKGIVELATTTETTTGTDTVRAVTPAGVKAVADTKANTSHTHTASQISDSTTVGRSVLTAADAAAARTAIGAGTSNLALGTTSTTAKAGDYAPPTSSDTVQGLVELATTAEATTGTDTARAVTPAGLKAVADTKLGIVSGSGLADAHKITQAAYTSLGAGRPSGRIYYIVG